VVMTSNIGNELWNGRPVAREAVLGILRQHFRPEFLNRVDEVVVFHSLTLEQLKAIVDIQLGRLRQLLAERHLTLDVTDAAKARLAEIGWDPTYGARPLKRAIQRELQDPLALKLLQGEFRDGETVRVAVEGDQLVFVKVLEGEIVAD
jgi:ATP-dependent Clp protease ATP-binding subunit ClpB